MKNPTEKIIPVRINADLHQQISHMAERTEHSSQDIMRLAMRIGLADLASAGGDLAELVRKICHDHGVSFQQWAASKTAAEFSRQPTAAPPKPRVSATENLHDSPPECPPTHAATAISTSTSPPNPPPQKIANIVPLLRPHVLATAGHWSLNESTTPPPVTETRKPTTYPKPKRKKNG